MNYKGWRRRRPMKGPRRKPFMPMPSLPGIIASGAQRADPDHWRARAEAEQEAEAGLQGNDSGGLFGAGEIRPASDAKFEGQASSQGSVHREALALSSHLAASASRNDLRSFRPSNYRPYLRSSVIVMGKPIPSPHGLVAGPQLIFQISIVRHTPATLA